MVTKQCCRCKQELPLNAFDKRPGYRLGLQHYCKECRKIGARKYYLERGKSKAVEGSIRRARATREWFQQLKTQLHCASCGENEACCLDFHHQDSNEKEFTISVVVARYSKTRIMQEIDKCIVLCANCHRKVHADKLSL